MDSRDFNPTGTYDTRQNPLPAPTQGVHDSPFMRLDINEFWWAHVSGQICRLLERDAWSGTDDEIDAAIANVAKILNFGTTHDRHSFWDNATVPGNTADFDFSLTELGIKFKVNAAGFVLGIRFYKSATNAGPHSGHLFADDGTLMGSVDFCNETASGWQEVYFTTPIAIAADTVYVAAYHAPQGNYSYDHHYFDSEFDRLPLIAPADSAVTVGNGVYHYGDAGSFPDNTNGATNYWVDLIFSTTGA